jgi:hypothetical protein
LFQFGVLVPAAALIVYDDDRPLRRLLCHEFAHCFWLIEKALGTPANGEAQVDEITHVRESGADDFAIQLAKDRSELAEPKDWFGDWDVENFLYEEVDSVSNELLGRRWKSRGLPMRAPDIEFAFAGELACPQEVLDRIEAGSAHDLTMHVSTDPHPGRTPRRVDADQK